MTTLMNNPNIERHRWIIRGQVQGVGFRPHVYRLARDAQITGFVANDNRGVIIEAQGPRDNLDHFIETLTSNAPPLARIDGMTRVCMDRRAVEPNFQIMPGNDLAEGHTFITPDTALCGQCRRELFDPANRRFHHPLITCTNCGPRYTIMTDVPYDRPATTMAGFTMCAQCQHEYADPADRRFHAQPISCPDCGPRLELVDPNGKPLNGDPMIQAAEMLRNGSIIAIKGIGGFHLAARADSQAAVNRLRELKQRDAKPFAIMCRSISDARHFIKISPLAQAAMESAAAPIILAIRQPHAPVAPAVAGHNHRLGVMLPYTPVHHLLFSHLNTGSMALVMTSGNMADEPLATDNSEALQRLGSMCDGFLRHDRPIVRCLDDSVLLDMGPGQNPVPIRRSRGLVPTPIALNTPTGLTGLCLGGELKNTVALVLDSRVILSQHLGDLNNQQTRMLFIQTLHDLCRLHKARPQFIAHDMHPMYISAQYAVQLARQFNARLMAVQHHHAHAAAVMAEHALSGEVLALVCDGTGLGLDATGWGCELLCASAESFERIASLKPLLLPGGDMAAKDIRRCALALLHQAFGSEFDRQPAALRLVEDSTDRKMLTMMISRQLQCVISSSAGRLFDGVAALLGLCMHNSFEGQAPMALESAASIAQPPPMPCGLWDVVADSNGVDRLDLRRLIRHLLLRQRENVPVEILAAVFHSQFAAGWEDIICRAAAKTGISTIVLSGGVFANELLALDMTNRLENRGLKVLRHQRVPPNDGGLALGQAMVATSRWQHDFGGGQTSAMERAICV
jgi:hydrogenase maturation protein HypF